MLQGKLGKLGKRMIQWYKWIYLYRLKCRICLWNNCLKYHIYWNQTKNNLSEDKDFYFHRSIFQNHLPPGFWVDGFLLYPAGASVTHCSISQNLWSSYFPQYLHVSLYPLALKSGIPFNWRAISTSGIMVTSCWSLVIPFWLSCSLI